jgi:hypothetical protein
MTKTTADCKKFLADFMTENNSIVLSIFGKIPEWVTEDIIDAATTAKKWKRFYKCKPGGGNYEFDVYSIFSRDIPIKRMGYDGLSNKKPATDFVSERGFMLDPDEYDTGVAFAVLEDKDGNLHLGDYIGD